MPNVDTVPLTRDLLKGESKEFQTFLEVDSIQVLKQLGLPEGDGCTRAIAIEFIGRKSAGPGKETTGFDNGVVTVDRLLGGHLVGKIRSRGLPGDDGQCATPPLPPTEVRAIDEANHKCLADQACVAKLRGN